MLPFSKNISLCKFLFYIEAFLLTVSTCIVVLISVPNFKPLV